MLYFLIFIIGYIIGSVPFSYLTLKFFHNKNILENGSGNAGTLNSYIVTKSVKSTIIVFTGDFFKGAAGILILRLVFEMDFIYLGIYTVSAILGHCYSVWIKFKGGRGLATAAGSVLFFTPVYLIVWAIIWIISYVYKKSVHFANIIATLFLGLSSIYTPSFFGNNFLSPVREQNNLIISLFGAILSIIILSRHWESLSGMFNFSRSKENGEA